MMDSAGIRNTEISLSKHGTHRNVLKKKEIFVNRSGEVKRISIMKHVANFLQIAYLYFNSRENPDTEEILLYNNQSSVNKSNFRADKTTVFIIHGWISNRTSAVNTVLTKGGRACGKKLYYVHLLCQLCNNYCFLEAFLQDSDVNVIVVDWCTIAGESYLTAVAALPAVGRHLGNFIKWLTTLGVTYDKVHVVGHSLGAHLAGNAGKVTEGKIKRITGGYHVSRSSSLTDTKTF